MTICNLVVKEWRCIVNSVVSHIVAVSEFLAESR